MRLPLLFSLLLVGACARTTERPALLAEGFGEMMVGPGEVLVERTVDGSGPPESGPSAALL